MTPRERLLRAMSGGKPDRVPFMCQMSIGHMLLQLGATPSVFWNDGESFADGLVRLREIYGFDGILVSLHGHDPAWRKKIRSRGEEDGAEVITWTDGGSTKYLPDDLPMHRSAVPRATRDPDEPIPTTITYIPVSGGLHFNLDPGHLFDIFPAVRKRCGPDISVHGEVTSAFDYFLDWFGYETGLMFLLDNPDRAKEILDTFARGVADIASAMCDEDIDAIKISSPFAGAGFLSRDHYDEFVRPYEKRLTDAIRSKGKYSYIHTCGSIGDRLDLMKDAGVDGLECLDPPPLGTTDLAEAFEQLGDSVFIKGNVDSVLTLLQSKAPRIREDAENRLRIGMKTGKFILSTACSIAPHVPREHILMLREVVEEKGVYR